MIIFFKCSSQLTPTCIDRPPKTVSSISCHLFYDHSETSNHFYGLEFSFYKTLAQKTDLILRARTCFFFFLKKEKKRKERRKSSCIFLKSVCSSQSFISAPSSDSRGFGYCNMILICLEVVSSFKCLVVYLRALRRPSTLLGG